MDIICRCPDCGAETVQYRPDHRPVVWSVVVACPCGTTTGHNHAIDGKPDMPDQWHKVVSRAEGPPSEELLRIREEREAERVARSQARVPDHLIIDRPGAEFHEEREVTDGWGAKLPEELSGFTVGAYHALMRKRIGVPPPRY